MKRTPGIISAIAFILSAAGQVIGADAETIRAAYEKMRDGRLETSSTMELASCKIAHKDFALDLVSGRLAFFLPIKLDSAEYYYGAYFEGEGQIRFRPTLELERDQLRRFFKSDSLDLAFKKVLIIFNRDYYQQILAAGTPSGRLFGSGERGDAADLLEKFTDHEQHSFLFAALQNMLEPSEQPFLAVSIDPEDAPPLFYIFNPLAREEVSLYRRYKIPGTEFMEEICNYSAYSYPPHQNLNGTAKPRVIFRKYDIDAAIDNQGNYRGITKGQFDVLKNNQQTVSLILHESLIVDSIIDSTGSTVSFIRYRDSDHKSMGLYLVFDRPLKSGENICLDYYYHGDIVNTNINQYYVTASVFWYPWGDETARAVFKMKFETPEDCKFVATGTLTEDRKEGRSRYTTWVVDKPASNVSFSIGYMRFYEFKEDKPPVVHIYYDAGLHREISQAMAFMMEGTTRNIEKDVAFDIMNSYRLFSHFFGPCPETLISASEIFSYHGEAYSGFLHMGIPTWVKTDREGYERAFRAHEVAHQWWGLDVEAETYHDQWLSEGLAEYSALLYIQAVLGNDKFLNMLETSRKELVDVYGLEQEEGAGVGAVIMGVRAGDTKTEGGYTNAVYDKGAYIFHMLRNIMIDLKTMNEDRFMGMLRELHQSYRGGEINTEDFKRLAEKYAGEDLSWFFEQWLYRTEIPGYKLNHTIEKDDNGQFLVKGTITRENVSPDFKMPLILSVELEKKGKILSRIWVDRDSVDFAIPLLDNKPKKVILNAFESVLAKIE